MQPGQLRAARILPGQGLGYAPSEVIRDCGAWVCGLARSLHLPLTGSVCGKAGAWPWLQMAVSGYKTLTVPLNMPSKLS